MPVLLFGIGVFAVVAGLVMIGFGIPINEFSFGNTLISAGTTAAVGGLIIIALGVAVGQLRRIAQMLADPVHAAAFARMAPPADDAESSPGARIQAASAPAGGRFAYPARPNERPNERPMERPMDGSADPFATEPEPTAAPFGGGRGEESFAPSLPNPDDTPMPPDDDISLSPRHPQAGTAPAAGPLGSLDRTSDSFDWRLPPPAPDAAGGAPGGSPPPPPLRQQPGNFDATPAAPLRQQPGNFDAMWPAEGRAAKSPSPGLASGPAAAPKAEPKAGIGAKPDARTDALAREAFPAGQPPRRPEPEPARPRTAAILKSGVVDGMGYTLYVDGSIEAELPQGTLRFASINELRSHLEKNS